MLFIALRKKNQIYSLVGQKFKNSAGMLSPATLNGVTIPFVHNEKI